jgi:hypothetical protein
MGLFGRVVKTVIINTVHILFLLIWIHLFSVPNIICMDLVMLSVDIAEE